MAALVGAKKKKNDTGVKIIVGEKRVRNNLIKSNYRAINHNTGFWGRVVEEWGGTYLSGSDWLAGSAVVVHQSAAHSFIPLSFFLQRSVISPRLNSTSSLFFQLVASGKRIILYPC